MQIEISAETQWGKEKLDSFPVNNNKMRSFLSDIVIRLSIYNTFTPRVV